MQDTRFYKTWENMKQRCLNRNHTHYKNYGGRGITVCGEWLTFEGFLRDMHSSYLKHSELHGELNTTLERIDVDGGYSKSNCCWITRLMQYNNRQARPSKSGHTGVFYRGAKYYAVMQTTGYYKYLGSYDTVEEAVKVREEARRKYVEEREAKHNVDLSKTDITPTT